MLEHETFHRLTEALREAASAASQLALIRANPNWERVAQGIRNARELVFKLGEKQ